MPKNETTRRCSIFRSFGAPLAHVPARDRRGGQVRGSGSAWHAQQPYEGFFDLWLISNQFEFEGQELVLAIAGTFENRGTELELEPVAPSEAFTMQAGTQKQWAAFVKRSQLEDAPKTLEQTRQQLRRFLLPVATAVVGAQEFLARWVAPGPWEASS